MPLPVQFIGQANPSPLSYLIGGFAQSQQEHREADILKDIFQEGPIVDPNMPQGKGPPGVMGEIPRNTQPSPLLSLQKILTTPMSGELRQTALQAWQAQQIARQRARGTGGAGALGQGKMPPQYIANVLKQIPADASPQEAYQIMLQNGVPVDTAKTILGQIIEKQKERADNPRQRAQDVRGQWDSLIKDVQDKSKGAFGGTAFRAGTVERNILDAQVRWMRQQQQNDMATAAQNPDAPLMMNDVQRVQQELDNIEIGLRGAREAKKEQKEEENKGTMESIYDWFFEGEREEKPTKRLDFNNPVDVEIGREILREAGGDVEKAKEMARKRGYTFD